MEQLQEQYKQLSTELELLKSKDVRDIKDAIRLLASKIDRLTPQGEQSESVAKLAEALAKAKLEKKPLKISGRGTNNSTYSTLEDYEEAYEEALANNGLSIVFAPSKVGQGEYVLVTRLVHSSGEWMRSVLPIDSAEELNRDGKRILNEEQGMGKSISYMKRYSYAAMMGV